MLNQTELLALLDGRGIEHKTVTHEAAFTVDQAQSVRGMLEGGHTKNLFLKDKKGQYFLVSALEDAEIDLKTIHSRIGGRGRVSFGQADKMESYLGVTPGSVTLFAALNDKDQNVTVIVDQKLAECTLMNAHPLINTATTQIATADLFELLGDYDHMPKIVDLTGPAPSE